ncbi:hypothetical protein Tco_1203866 [Tanacetum coccineum]
MGWVMCSDAVVESCDAVLVFVVTVLHCTDIAKIARKRSKPDKHGHGNGIECTKAGRMLSWSTLVNQKSTHIQLCIIQVPSSDMAKQNVTKLPYWSILDEGITRGFKEAHIDKGFYTKLLAKETQKGSDTRMPRWQSVCSKINPTVKNKDLMIEMKEGCGFKERLTNSGA